MTKRQQDDGAADEVGVTEHDSNYIGTNPEYENSAYIINAPVGDGEEDEATQRVREHLEAMKQPAAEVQSFEDWTAARAAESTGTTAEDDDDAEDVSKADLMEEARDLEIAGRSSMTKDELAAAVADAKAAEGTPS
jgi:hypothetical protein